MAHAIDMTTGKAAVFVTGEPAWHKLGKVIESAATSAEAIQLAGLDWQVEQWELAASDPVGVVHALVYDLRANVRTDTNAVLGVVGKDYRIFQNRNAFDFMDSLVGDKLAMYETAGSLHGGKRVWMLARIPKEYRAGTDDLIKPYILLTNTHDGSQSLRMIPTTIRVVCQNTLNLALREARSEGVSITHHARLDERVKEARTKLGILAARFDQFDDELHAMLDKDLNVQEASTYFRKAAGLDVAQLSDRQKKARAQAYGQMIANFDNEKNSIGGIRHTAWSAYNAVSEFADHQKVYRGSTASEKANNQLSSIWFGASNELKQDAYSRALELSGFTV